MHFLLSRWSRIRDLATAENPIVARGFARVSNWVHVCHKPHADCSDGEADARAAEGVNGPLCGRSGKQHRQQTRAPPGACSSPGAGACSRRLAPRCLSAPAVIERACLRPRRSAPRLVRRPGAAVNGTHGPLPESAGFPRRSCGRGVRGRPKINPIVIRLNSIQFY